MGVDLRFASCSGQKISGLSKSAGCEKTTLLSGKKKNNWDSQAGTDRSEGAAEKL